MDPRAYYAGLGAAFDGEAVAHFGAPDLEAAAAVAGDGAQLAPLLAVSPLRITGSDRASFLHGQLSNRVEGLAVGACNHTLQLNVRGQVIGEGVLCARRDDLFLAVEDGRGAAVRSSLEQHIVFDDVAVSDLSGELTALTVQGATAATALRDVLGEPPGTGSFACYPFEGAEALVLPRKRSRSGGYDLHLPVRRLPGLVGALRAAGAELAGGRAVTLARVLAGVPSAAADGGNGSLPQELDLEGAISYSKGCYLGQEIMARVQGRGSVRKRLARVLIEGADGASAPMPELGESILRLGGRDVGRLGSVTCTPDGRQLGLAVVRRDLPADASLELGRARVRLVVGEAS
jgi:folate-binding protein YgfZ